MRGEVNTARSDLSRAATLGAWALLYAIFDDLVGGQRLIAIVIAATARHRVRTATDAYASIIEAAARLHVTELAAKLGVNSPPPIDQNGDSPPARPLAPELGRALTRHLRTVLPAPRPGEPSWTDPGH